MEVAISRRADSLRAPWPTFASSHDVFAAKTRVAADNYLHGGPLTVDTLDQAGEFRDAVGREEAAQRNTSGEKCGLIPIAD